MRRHTFALVFTSFLIGSNALALDEIPQTTSNLEREQNAKREQEEELDENVFMAIVLVAVLAVPVVVVSLFLVVRKDSSGPTNPGRRAESRKPRTKPAERQPAERSSLADRPGLAARLEGYTAAKAKAEPIGGGKPNEHPPFFLVRATYKAKRGRMARIYVLAEELLVIDAGPGADFHGAAGVAAAALSGGGAIGAFIGGAVGSMIADDERTGGEAFQQKLDRLNLDGLLEWAKEEGNLRAPFADLVGVSIDAGGDSYRRDGARTIGRFRFRYLKRGEYSFEFLCPAEVRGGIELLKRVMSTDLYVGSGWDEVTARYLEGV
jgi:hypothetical protein